MPHWIRWNGDVQDGGTVNQSVPASTAVKWGDNSYTWGDVQFISDIKDGIGTGSRRARQDRLNKLIKDEEKKKRLKIATHKRKKRSRKNRHKTK